ncbi:hypothetical protein CIP107534_00552 [Corynebacterium diphtheriae]|uniref:hypothetical protein n=1 Tax=Corynebacterium diphtheriae TaxID=1717 RepID=UPI000929A011|nr:hypothetical protein [Corynebacterium diphtheriae]OJH92132.1 hypothetical protein BKD80_05865 [Corynebacterium diphtheriae]OWN73170.1 hypothetical protein AY516_04190 [Corynebacterium diphtheriae bv. mitis]RKW88157.1 hypothetical protein D9B38_11955 [Corynebacterium diphtheriae]CAB0495598.1 hypothetical protein CIP107506_00523 [Corynebacterium diphtheriae]CAB0543303.1 hypothetical protein CIP107521_00724 [Corynebacterium diphtheriae]
MNFIGRAVRSTRAGLLILSISAMLRAWSYAPWQVDQQRRPVHWLESLTTPMVWGGVWAGIAFMLVVAIFCHRLIPIAVGLVVSIHAAWCLSFTWQTLIGESPRAWVTAISYGSTSLLVLWTFSRAYPPPHMDIRRRE